MVNALGWASTRTWERNHYSYKKFKERSEYGYISNNFNSNSDSNSCSTDRSIDIRCDQINRNNQEA